MKITQCEYAEKRMDKFEYFLEKYNLKKYSSPNEPSIFFGMYGKLCFKTLKKHKSLAIVIWRGTDIITKNKLERVKALNNKNIKHVAISYYIAKDLEKLKIDYKFIPLNATKIDDLKVEPLGEEVYAYLPARFDFYGGDIIMALKDKLPFKFTIADGKGTFTRNEMIDVYKRSFMGLRCTKHDGIANQVVEMGIMGRKCIHNGNHPNAIRHKKKTIDEIAQIIIDESKHIGEYNHELSEKVSRYIDVGDKWSYTDYWK